MADDSNPGDVNDNARRDAMWAQAARLLALINGGAVVTLMAFVQAI